MKFSEAIDEFLADRRSEGRINSDRTEAAYRDALERFCDQIGDCDVDRYGRDDIKAFLRSWPHPNSRRQKHAILASFGKWAMEEGHRETNPAQMVPRAKQRPVHVYRPTLAEVVALLDASMAERRERWVVHLGLLAGLRRQELSLLQGRHLRRHGWVWVSADIGKGHRERWMPVTEELEPIVAEILALVEPGAWVTPSRASADPPFHTRQVDRDKPISGEGLYRLVRRVGRRAGLVVDIGPHTLRHGYGDHVARYAGLKAAQALMGHASVETTESTYTGAVTLDELAVSLHGFSYRRRLSAGAPTVNPHPSPDAR